MRKVLMVFSIIMASGVVALLAWANWPVPVENQTNQLHLVAPETWSAEDIAKVNAIKFDYTILYPKSMKAGQVGQYQVIFTGLPDSIQVAGQIWQVHIHSELLLPGFLNLSEGMFSQSVQMGTPLRSTWDVKAIDERNTEGILRTYVEYVAPQAHIEPQLLSVTDLTLTSSNLFGLSTGGINSLAVAFLLLSGLTGSLGLTRPHV
jgi:hypothetical protein